MQYEPRVYSDAQSIEHKYRLLLPAGYDQDSATTYPLVLFLHGAGERGEDNQLQLKHGAPEFLKPARRQQYPCIVVVPQCPSQQKWVEVDWTLTSGKDTFIDQPSAAMATALGIVDQWVQSGRVDKSRIYVTGISMGGYGTWFASASANHLFAAALPICGGGDPTWANRYGTLPIWNFHGSADSTVVVERSREMMAALSAVDHRPEAKYTEYADGPHDVWTQTYQRDDVFEWLFSQRK
jgi:predicted peptidase